MSGDQRQAPPADLREQVDAVMREWQRRKFGTYTRPLAEAAVAVFAERERLLDQLRGQLQAASHNEREGIERLRQLREQVEALRKPFIGQTRYGYNDALDDVLEALWPQLP